MSDITGSVTATTDPGPATDPQRAVEVYGARYRANNKDAATALAWGLVDAVAAEGGLDAEVDKVVEALLKCGPEALRAQKALLRQWEELPLTESVDLSIGVFGRSFLSEEPKRLMQEFINRKR